MQPVHLRRLDVDLGVVPERLELRAGAQMNAQTFPLRIRKPMIAAINGACAGLGLMQAVNCDVRFAARGARFSTAYARRGQPVIELKPVRAEKQHADSGPRWTVEEQMEWLRARRVGRKPAKTDAATLVRQMRDEEWR